MDTTAADMLADLDEALNAQGISLVFAELKDPVRAQDRALRADRPAGPDHFFPTLDDAVEAYREQTGVDWAPPTGTVPEVPEV